VWDGHVAMIQRIDGRKSQVSIGLQMNCRRQVIASALEAEIYGNLRWRSADFRWPILSPCARARSALSRALLGVARGAGEPLLARGRWLNATVLSQGDHSCIPIRAMVWPQRRAGTK
jgi:hypothetical protein